MLPDLHPSLAIHGIDGMVQAPDDDPRTVHDGIGSYLGPVLEPPAALSALGVDGMQAAIAGSDVDRPLDQQRSWGGIRKPLSQTK
jgi:hypothetical protein